MRAVGTGLLVARFRLVVWVVLALSARVSAGAGNPEVEAFHLNQTPPPAQPSTRGSKDTGELAKQLTNPVADLITVPFQNNFYSGLGPDGDKNAYLLSVQPVIPFSLNEDWNLITRVIVPVIYEEGLTDALHDNWGLGDTEASFFFSPKRPSWRGWMWGAGPVFLVPTATDTALGTGKWGAGPTAVGLRQDGPWTYGMLVNHVWSFAGDGDRPYVNATFLEPFVAYSTQGGFTVSLLTESTYDWRERQWTVPIQLSFAQVIPVGDDYVQIEVGPTYFAERPAGGPDWGFRVSFVLLFPR